MTELINLEEIKNFGVNLFDLTPIGMNYINDKIDPNGVRTIDKYNSDGKIVLFKTASSTYFYKEFRANCNKHLYSICQFLNKMLGIRTYFSINGLDFMIINSEDK